MKEKLNVLLASTSTMHERIRVRVHGRVQRVMYRDFAQRHARALQLVGSVYNEQGATVYLEVEGPERVLEQYCSLLRRGPLLAKVESMVIEKIPVHLTEKDFHILYPQTTHA